jgi:carbon-monoxide dehydrogenase small subunit
MRVNFTVNGRQQEADDVWEGESLLYVLRERMGLPGSKNACEQGECGSCTVRLDGVPVCSCLVAADEMLEHNPSPTDADIREALSGNLCRCTGYEKIMDAVRLAAARQSEAV